MPQSFEYEASYSFSPGSLPRETPMAVARPFPSPPELWFSEQTVSPLSQSAPIGFQARRRHFSCSQRQYESFQSKIHEFRLRNVAKTDTQEVWQSSSQNQ